MLLLISTGASAQLFKPKKKSPAKSEYTIGTVPVENKRVVFREAIDAKGLTAAQIMECVQGWYAERFVEPTIIETKLIESSDYRFEAKVEEYIVFTKKFFVLNRARIYYYMTIDVRDNHCELIMSRITYWHDDENPDGGTRYTAEEIITDGKAIDSDTKALDKEFGKFRTKTIDLKNSLVKELQEKITVK